MTNILYIGNNLQSKQNNPSYMQTLGNLLEMEGHVLFYASSKKNKLFRLMDMLKTCYKHRKTIDVVLIDTYSTLNFFYAFFVSRLCKLLKLKYIPILHGGNLPMRLKQYPKLCTLIFKNAYANVSPSNYLKEIFERFGYNNIVYIPNTIVLENYQYEEREFSTMCLLWVRSFSEIYNPKLAINVLKSLKDKGLDASLCMVGPDSDGSLAKVKAYAKLQNVDVVFSGKLSKEKWINFSKDYNLFLNTTNFDNTPVSVIEAMALGIPVISTNVGGMPHLISDKIDGLLVEKNNVKAMVNAIMEIINNEKLAQTLSQNARHKVEQFDWQVVKKAWHNILQ